MTSGFGKDVLEEPAMVLPPQDASLERRHGVRGHKEAQARVLNLIEANRLPHALLLTGPQGIGKKLFSKQLAGVLLSGRVNTSLRSEKTFESFISPEDEKHIYAHTHPNLWDDQGEDNPQLFPYKIETIRSVSSFFQKTAGIEGARVALLPDLHLFNSQALNALLKGLEEPPCRSFLILTSHKPGVLPKTILSRVHQLRLGYPDTLTYEVIIRQQVPEIDGQTLRFLKSFSPSPGLALACWRLGGETHFQRYERLLLIILQDARQTATSTF